MNKAIINFLSNALKTILSIAIGLVYFFAVIFFSLIPTLLEIKDDSNVFGFIFMFVAIFSPLIFILIFKKDAKKELLKEGKELIVGIWYLIIVMGVLLGILIIISLFFITVSAIFSWLAGLGVATLLALILIVIVLK
jgi:hypothetical protein